MKNKFFRSPLFKSKRNIEAESSINAVAYEISVQDLVGNSGAGINTALCLTKSGQCSTPFTLSYECVSSQVIGS